MTQFYSILFLTFFIVLSDSSRFINGQFFEYDLPNRTITICPSYSLVSLECPQIPSLSTNNLIWQSNLPKYFISIDYIRSFPLRLGFDPRSCQPDLSHACNNYDLRYINSLCNGKPHCSDISAYQIRERSLCAFKAVTEIAFHCVPTWNLQDIQTKYDICKNSSLTNDYGFIYSRNYPLKTTRTPCFTSIYTRPNHKIILYYVNGELNHDQLRIESVTYNGISILNISLNGNLTTQRLTTSNYEIKITFLPSQIYSYHPTYYLLYFYMIPTCTINDPCPSESTLFPIIPQPLTTGIIPSFFFPTTNRIRIQSVGWTKVQNIWIVVPIILAYVLLLLLIVVLALLLQRRRKQRKLLEDMGKTTLSSRYLDASGVSSRAQLVTSISPISLPPFHSNNDSYSSHNRHHPSLNSSFKQNLNRYQRESQSDIDLYRNNNLDGIDYRHHASIPNRIRPTTLNDNNYRGYDTMDYSSNNLQRNSLRRSLPKSFSDCDLCKRRILDEENQKYSNEKDDNWRLEDTTIDRKNYRDKIKERSTIRQISDNELIPSPTVEYSTVLPRHQRITNQPIVHHLPFEYISNDNENQTKNYHNRCLHNTREIQEMSMRMNERHQYYDEQ